MGRWVAAWALLLVLLWPESGRTGDNVRVSTLELEPFVIDTGGSLSGFSIDLWDEIAVRLGVETSYHTEQDVAGLFDSLRNGTADAAVSGLFYSVERDQEFDFSYPIIQTGLRIMVRETGGIDAPNWLQGLMALLFSKASLIWVGIALVLVFFAAHVVWLLEYLENETPALREKYIPGIFRAMYWAATTLMGQSGEQGPRQWLARMLTVFWMFVGIIFIASYTAQLTMMLTVQRIHGTIDGPEDLIGKRVATLAGSSAIPYLRQRGAVVAEFPQNEEVYRALLDGRADAVVQGAAGLEYYATHQGRGLVRMVGTQFNENGVGFAFPLQSPLRKKVDTILLGMREDGSYQRIFERWFGLE